MGWFVKPDFIFPDPERKKLILPARLLQYVHMQLKSVVYLGFTECASLT